MLTDRIGRYLRRPFDIREGEGLRVSLMSSYIFLVVSSLMIVKPVSSAMFLSRFGVARLPYVFILVAVLAALVSAAYARALKTHSLPQLSRRTLQSAIIMLLVVRLLLYVEFLSGALLFIFTIWTAIFAVIATSQFWVFANSIFNPREAKRLFGVIGSSAIGGGLFGGYLTKAAANTLGSANLLFVCIGFLCACIPIIQTLGRKTAGDEPLHQLRQQEQGTDLAERPWKLVLQSRHLKYLAGIVGIGVITAKLVEYQYSAIASAAIQDTDELAAFFGFWLSNLNVLSLVCQLVVTRRVVGTFGVGFSLFFLPVGILFGAVAILVHPSLWAAVFIKLCDGSLKNSINKAGIELLSLPIPAAIKKSAKSFIDIFVDSTATGLGGFLLLAAVMFQIPVRHVSFITIGMLAIWLLLIHRIRIEYLNLFRLKLNEQSDVGDAGTAAGSTADSILGSIIQIMDQGDPPQILRVLSMVKDIRNPRLAIPLKRLLDHRNPEIRLNALKLLYFYREVDCAERAEEIIHTLANTPMSQALKTEAMHYLFQSRNRSGRTMMLAGYIGHRDPAIASAALLCAARESRRNPKLKKTFKIGAAVEDRMRGMRFDDGGASTREAKITCARIIGAANIPELHAYLHILLKDSSTDVLHAAILSAGESRQKNFLPILIGFLGRKDTGEVAAEGLVKFGASIVEELLPHLTNPFVDVRIQSRIPGVLALTGTQKAVNTLIDHILHPEQSVRFGIIRALNKMRVDYPELRFDSYRVFNAILTEARDYLSTLAVLYQQIQPAGARPAEPAAPCGDPLLIARRELIGALEGKLDESLERMFRLLGLKYPPEDIYKVYKGLRGGTPDVRTSALEFLDNILETDLKKTIMPIVETPLVEAMIVEVLKKFDLDVPSEFECLTTLLSGNDPEIQIKALGLVRLLKEDRYLPFIGRLLHNSDEGLREEAAAILIHEGFLRG